MNDPKDQKPKQRRRRRGRVGFWTVASILLLAGLLFVFGLSITGRSLNAPDWVTARVTKSVNDNLDAGRVTIGRLQMQVDSKGIPRILFGDLGVFDEFGAEVVRLNDISSRVSLPALFQGDIKPASINLNGAQMTLRRRKDGKFNILFGDGSGATGTLPDVLDLLDGAMAKAPLDKVDFLGAEDMTITLEDARSGRLWQITDGNVQVRRGENGLDISVSFDVFNGTEELAETVIGIRTDFATSQVSIGTSFKNAASGDMALQSPVLSFLGVLKAPISGAIRVDFGNMGELAALSGTLEIGQGALQPRTDIAPLPFTSAKSYFEFDPDQQKIEFSEVSFISDTASLVAEGHAYLNDFREGWPSILVGQFKLSDLKAQPEGVFDQEIEFSQGAADFRLNLNPFEVEIGQLVLVEGEERLLAKGNIAAGESGWSIGADLSVSQITHDRLLSIWPVAFSPNTRNWLLGHLTNGVLSDVRAAIRIKPGQPIRRSIGWQFDELAVRYIDAQPEIVNASGYATIDGDAFTLVVEKGLVVPPLGGAISIRDSSVQIPDLTLKPAPIKIRLNGSASNTAVLSLLNENPFRILRNASFGPDVVEGQAGFEAEIDFSLKRKIEIADVTYLVKGSLQDVESQKLIPGRNITADSLSLVANNQFVEISGPLKLGQVGADMVWRQVADETGKSSVSGSVELSQAFIDEFNIGLPKGSVQGTGTGQFQLDLVRNEQPRFTLTSDLNRVGLRIAQIGWNKARNSAGSLNVAGVLGAKPKIELLEINAGGLNASGGSVIMAEDGSMKSAAFTRVRIGGWLDAPVVLRGRGPGSVPSVHLTSGSIDVRETAFGGGNGTSSGAGGPISLALDRVIVSQGMVLTNFVGDFNSAGGLNGNFTARMNGKSELTGRLVPDSNGTAIRIQSDNAGGVLRDAGVVEYANNGSLDLTLRPRSKNGVYDGSMNISGTNVRNAPGMADLLSAISIVGLLEQLSGQGIFFDTVEAKFRLSPTSVQLTRSSAVGPSLGVSLDGLYNLTTSTMDMQGVVSPVYFLNGIGQIFTRKGEGLFGFNFRLKGTSASPKVTVNPLSILTPGLFRDIFRAPPPKPSQ